ncbi:MAG: hypothetical protein F6K36_02355 [Symploca sp. SIO3C6]|uniref:Uncharacterized protein n=1 Tax=Symploca sp. SIO1C4 TaxID=2607765 RepID=A0A6B3NRF7_9CYAN|nr:hypothetical protein [Symploca sp. SIO3C6]NER31778.1 hypothetical protein [Symploca sp. SIO1C4]NET05681.1 hypothetical protein [Symploca sp. SIO2B6]NET50565.1 hypothetical protein [Merismopedia sp. SIO2A8]
MTSPVPLKGTDLVDCVRANAKQGIETTAQLCGYGEDINTFKQELEKACDSMGVDSSNLISQQDLLPAPKGKIIAPETTSEL